MTERPERNEAGTTPAGRPGLTTFTIEGRAAPGLFVVGWLASLLGLGCVVVGLLAGRVPAVLVVGLALLAVGLVAAAGSQAIERRARGDLPYAGPSPVLIFVAAIPAAYLVAIVVGFVLSAAGIDAPGPAADLLLIAIQGAVYVGLVALLVVGSGALTWAEMGLWRDAPRAVNDLAWGAVLAGPVIGLTLVVAALLVALLEATPPSPLPPTGETAGLVLHLIAGAVIAPVAEEVLFRGVATTAWVRRYGEWSGILRAAFFFAIAHVLLLGGATVSEALAVAIVGFAGRLPVAIALGWVYVRRRSLWAAIGLHSTFNAVLLIVAHVATTQSGVPTT